MVVGRKPGKERTYPFLLVPTPTRQSVELLSILENPDWGRIGAWWVGGIKNEVWSSSFFFSNREREMTRALEEVRINTFGSTVVSRDQALEGSLALVRPKK